MPAPPPLSEPAMVRAQGGRESWWDMARRGCTRKGGRRKLHSVPLSSRFAWALEVLPVKPQDRVLEVGCGHGVMLRELASKLTSGHLVGVDRSAKMTALARKAADTRRLTLLTGAFPEVPPAADGRFDLAFALNVALFGHEDEAGRAAATALAKLLAPQGSAYLFFESPAWRHVEAFAQGAAANLREAGLRSAVAFNVPLGVCVTATCSR